MLPERRARENGSQEEDDGDEEPQGGLSLPGCCPMSFLQNLQVAFTL